MIISKLLKRGFLKYIIQKHNIKTENMFKERKLFHREELVYEKNLFLLTTRLERYYNTPSNI